jgi:hypothetical protein
VPAHDAIDSAASAAAIRRTKDMSQAPTWSVSDLNRPAGPLGHADPSS